MEKTQPIYAGALARLWHLHLRLKAEVEDVKRAPHTFTQLWCGEQKEGAVR